LMLILMDLNDDKGQKSKQYLYLPSMVTNDSTKPIS
jgi:hypothetical protein